MGLLLPCRVAGARGRCGYTQLGTSQRGSKGPPSKPSAPPQLAKPGPGMRGGDPGVRRLKM